HYHYAVAVRVHRDATSGPNDQLSGILSGNRVPGVGEYDVNDDGLGGILATWKDTQPIFPPEYTGQVGYFGAHWNASGLDQWPWPTAVPLVQHPVPDGTGAAYLVAKPGGQSAFFVYRRSTDGAIAPGWTAAGMPLSNPDATGTIYSRSIPSGL